MTFDPNSLLTEAELTIPRTPMELSAWVQHKCRLFADCQEAKEWVLLRQGLSKKFHEEIYPLSIFVTHLYSKRSDIQCIPNLDNRDFDARILDYSMSPPFEQKIEITSAVDGYENHLRMKYLVEHGQVNVWGTLSASGTKKRGHKIHVENEMIAHTDIQEHTFDLILSAVKRKSMNQNTPQKYGQGHVLVVAFDDWNWFKPREDMESLKEFVKKHILILPLNFAAIYVVGLSGKSFCKFSTDSIKETQQIKSVGNIAKKWRGQALNLIASLLLLSCLFIRVKLNTLHTSPAIMDGFSMTIFADPSFILLLCIIAGVLSVISIKITSVPIVKIWAIICIGISVILYIYHFIFEFLLPMRQ
jgi:hypothetical protein